MTDLASDRITLDWTVARLNIERLQRRLSEEIDETKRRTLIQLIVEEATKLSPVSLVT